MNRRVPILALLLCLAAHPATAEVIRLKSGQWLQGEIVEHTESEFRFERWDTGGVVTIAWDSLLAEDALRIQRQLGYVTEEDIQETVRGVQVLLKDGKLYEGLLLSEGGGVVRIKTAFRTIEVPVDEIKPASNGSLHRPVELQITKIYSRRELYDEKFAELEALNSGQEIKVQAQNHYVFSDWLMRAGYLEEAREHLQQAMELDPEYQTRFEETLVTIEEKIARKAIEDRFEEVRTFARSRTFDRAFAALDAIASEVPAEQLTRDPKAERDWVQAEKDRYMAGEVPEQFFRNLRNLASARARDRKSTFAESLQYAGQEMGTAALQKAAADLGIEEAEATQYFGQRSRQTRNASFSSGTFIVGSGVDGEAGGAAPPGGGRGAGGGRGGNRGGNAGGNQGQQQEDPKEVWWRGASSTTKGNFLYAYHCLQNFEVVNNKHRPCQNCGGKGFLTRLNSGVGGGSGTSYECPRCHGSKYDRSIQFK